MSSKCKRWDLNPGVWPHSLVFLLTLRILGHEHNCPPSVPIRCCWRKPKGLGLQLIWKRKLIVFSPFPGWGLSEFSIHWKNQKMSVRKMQERKKWGHTCIQEPEDSVPVKAATLFPSKIQMQSFGRNWKTSFYFMCKRVWPKQPQAKRSSAEKLRGTQWLRTRTHKAMLVMTEGRKCLHYDS